MTPPIDLVRQFLRWGGERDVDPDVLRYVDALGTALTWNDLLERHRVVILAEAGSGKSTELSRQAELLRAEGREAFIATLQNIGRKGFERALGKADWARFEAWKQLDTPAWLFLDSVDEAK